MTNAIFRSNCSYVFFFLFFSVWSVLGHKFQDLGRPPTCVACAIIAATNGANGARKSSVAGSPVTLQCECALATVHVDVELKKNNGGKLRKCHSHIVISVDCLKLTRVFEHVFMAIWTDVLPWNVFTIVDWTWPQRTSPRRPKVAQSRMNCGFVARWIHHFKHRLPSHVTLDIVWCCVVVYLSSQQLVNSSAYGYQSVLCFTQCFTISGNNCATPGLICGHLGCGRYQDAHAKDHATEFRHRFCRSKKLKQRLRVGQAG